MSRVVYEIVSASSENQLATDVQARLDCGWQLQGGISVSTTTRDGDTAGSWYAQAMVLTVETGEGA